MCVRCVYLTFIVCLRCTRYYTKHILWVFPFYSHKNTLKWVLLGTFYSWGISSKATQQLQGRGQICTGVRFSIPLSWFPHLPDHQGLLWHLSHIQIPRSWPRSIDLNSMALVSLYVGKVLGSYKLTLHVPPPSRWFLWMIWWEEGTLHYILLSHSGESHCVTAGSHF